MTAVLVNCRDCEAITVVDDLLTARRTGGIHQGKHGHVVAIAEVDG